MGDNIWLDDRDAVRTPMQWNPDRNAGFSNADPGKLYLPVIQSLVYNYAMANVEAEAAHSGSLLRWTRQILSVRKNHPAFGLGAFKHVEADHDAVVAYLRELSEDNTAGCPANPFCAPSTFRSTLSRQNCGFRSLPAGPA
ncbi:trehalose synthase/amylase TreS [Arthrobacter sp. Hiyo4]|nr:trehalose synthase/amylase TreS [Arthrobacter sp. Hiyo4]